MDYVSINQALWNSRVPHHYSSDFYDVPSFLNGANTITEIERPLLGDVRGKEIIHLQCHFGQDTLSLARMGAHVTGVDFSEAAVAKANELSTQTGLAAQFVQCDVHDAPARISKPADIVFTTYGVLGWLPDMQRWAQVVADCLKPGGELVLAEFHPAMWMFDDDFSKVAYSYFNREPIITQEVGTYADTGAPISQESVGWNHSIGEVVSALLSADFQITYLQEYDFSPYPCFRNCVAVGDKRWNIAGFEGELPMVWALKAVLM